MRKPEREEEEAISIMKSIRPEAYGRATLMTLLFAPHGGGGGRGGVVMRGEGGGGHDGTDCRK